MDVGEPKVDDMNSIFQRKDEQDEFEKKLTQLPEPPSVDQIVADLEDSSPSDVVFNCDVAALLDAPAAANSDVRDIPKRFLNLADTSPDTLLYEKVIQHNQNVERIKTLRGQLTEAQGSLSQLKEDLEDDITRASADFKKAADLHQEVNNSSSNQ